MVNKKNWRNLVGNNAKLSGDINESIIISHLMKSGWDVFKNMSCTGPVDMIAYCRDSNKIIKLDAKSARTEPTSEQKENEIYTCYINDNEDRLTINKGNECIEI